MKLQFFGAAQTVTGSRTLISHRGSRVLVDCGLFQGPKEKRLLNWTPFIDATTVNAMILTHAHIDHSGYLPKLVKDGFKGPVYCSSGTQDLARILLLDTAHLQEEDALYANQSGYSHHRPALPLFTEQDALAALKLLKQVKDEEWHPLSEHVRFRLTRSGHILGSRFVQVAYDTHDGSKTVTFSGDLGNGRSQVLKPPVTGLETDDLVLEATYGNRVQPRVDPKIEMASIIRRVAKRDGVLVIPAFSVGRTQEILLLIRQLEDAGMIPSLPVYVDSPMANHATEIYMSHTEDHQLVVIDGALRPPICSSDYEPIRHAQDSMVLCMRKGPMIVISAAGMLTGGRIMHHLKHRLPKPENAVLFVGYQAEETKGRLLQDGIKELRIHHQNIPVRAEILTIDSLSAHADADDTIEWIKSFRRGPKRILLNHGEPDALRALAERIRSELGIETRIPEPLEEIEL
ncbi:MAG TPA: MBL fold metallo-hydrolase [Bdellovibrionales bacterium]|nr:MBL fold metallo-hydrolase [Bdellovibrionales bacterium]